MTAQAPQSANGLWLLQLTGTVLGFKWIKKITPASASHKENSTCTLGPVPTYVHYDDSMHPCKCVWSSFDFLQMNKLPAFPLIALNIQQWTCFLARTISSKDPLYQNSVNIQHNFLEESLTMGIISLKTFISLCRSLWVARNRNFGVGGGKEVQEGGDVCISMADLC